MTTSRNNRWFFFFLGLTSGVAISLFIFFYFQTNINGQFSENKIDTAVKIEKPAKGVHESKSKPSKVQKKKPHKKKPIIKDTITRIAIQDSILTDTLVTDSIPLVDSIDNENNTSDIVVVKDELLYSKQMIPSGDIKGFLCDNSSKLDSLLVDNITSISQEGILVEFWKSPVNFKGYKLNKRKLILFGILEFDKLQLEYIGGKSLTLHYGNQDFNLKCTEDFLPLNIQK